MKLFVGNIAYATTEEGLRAHFDEFGPLLSVKIATDRDTGRSRGFGFIEVGSKELGEQAMSRLNGTELDGKALVVNEARPKEAGRSGGGGGFRGGSRDRDGGNSFGRSQGRSSSRGGYSGGRW